MSELLFFLYQKSASPIKITRTGTPRPTPRPTASLSNSLNPGLAVVIIEDMEAPGSDGIVGRIPAPMLGVAATVRLPVLSFIRNSSLVQVPVLPESATSQ